VVGGIEMNIEKCSSGYTAFLGRRGGILVMAALAAVFMISMIAMVTDIGYMYYSQARLQTAVNAGWKAGYDRLAGYDVGKELTSSEKESIRAHIREVIRSNGFSQEELNDDDIVIDVNRNSLRVVAKGKIGLFFARIMNVNSTEVAAIRDNESSFAGIIPLAIPHGTTKDFSKKMYSCSLFGADSGFRDGEEYILKLGSGAGNTEVPPEQEDLKMILIPMILVPRRAKKDTSGPTALPSGV